VTINYIKALAQEGLAENITVIATLNAESPWAQKLPEKVRFIEFGKMYPHLSPEEQEKLLTRVLLQKAPQVIHNIHSDLGYRIFVKYGHALRTYSRLYTSSFCTDVSTEGRLIGYSVLYVPKCFEVLEGLLSDNQAHLDELHKMFAFAKEKMHALYQPVRFSQKRHLLKNRIAPKEQVDILWAGRLDRQKRPDILIGIAEQCQDLPFTFHVYGSPVLDTDIYQYKLKKLNNIVYHGPFNGLCSVPIEDYDLFLYTSQWDGMPNVLLEAVSVGLPIIASNVGGVGELILHEKTGFLVDPFDNIDKYVGCIKRINNDRSVIPLLISNAQALLKERHSWGVFVDAVKRVPGYVLKDEQHLPARAGELELRKK
jgi:glycosyltransferase involved in cell wall biosynthesis